MSDTRYLAPGWFTRNVFNRFVRRLSRLGISVLGSRELSVRGRTSGEWRSTPVNLLTVDGDRYLVAPRGETQWVRNVRAAGGAARLHLGRRIEPIMATELPDEVKPAVLRAYLERWKWEVGQFVDDLDVDDDAQVAAAAPGFPVFRVDQAQGSGR